MVSLSRATPFQTFQAAPPQAAATTQTQRPQATQAQQALTIDGGPRPTQGAPASPPDLQAVAIKLLKVVLELLMQLLGRPGGQGQQVPNDGAQGAVAQGGLGRNGNAGGGKMSGGHWGVVHTCKSGWITPEVKELTKYGYNPLRQGVGTPYDSAVSSWERDHGRKFPGLQF